MQRASPGCPGAVEVGWGARQVPEKLDNRKWSSQNQEVEAQGVESSQCNLATWVKMMSSNNLIGGEEAEGEAPALEPAHFSL